MKAIILVQKLRRIVCLTMLMLLSFSAFAQNESNALKQENVIALLDSLEQKHDQADFRAFVVSALKRLSRLMDQDLDEEGYEAVLALTKSYFGPGHRLTALILHQLSIFQYRKKKYDDALVSMKHSIKLRTALIPDNHPEMGHAWFVLGLIFDGQESDRQENLNAAIAAFKNSLNVYEILNDPSMVINNLRRLGGAYEDLEEQELAEVYFDLTLTNARIYYDLDDPRLANLYLFAANVFSDNPEAQIKALDYYQLSQQIFERGNNEDRSNYASALINQGAIYIDINNYEAAFKALNRALLLKSELEDNSELDVIYEYIGAIYRRQNKYDQSLAAYQKTLEIRKNEEDLVSEDINYAYHNLGEVYQEIGDFPKAASYYQQALQAADQNFKSADFAKNPELENLDLSVEYTDVIKDLDFKGQLFYEWYKSEGEVSKLKIALATYKRAIELIEDKRGDLISDGSKLFWQEKLFPVFENALTVAFEIYEKQGLPEMKGLIYEWMEQSKSMVLLESLAAQQEEMAYIGQDSLLRQIEFLTDRVSDLQRQVIENTKDGRLRKELLKAQIDYWETKRTLKEYQSSFTNELKELDKVTLSGFQAQLKDEHALFVEYFVGNQVVFALFFNKNESYTLSTKLDNIPKQTKRLRGLLSSPNESYESFEAFQKVSHQLYLQLLSAGLNNFTVPVDKVTIIPDGILAALPFEVLLDQPSEEKIVNYAPDQLPYLMNKHAINYAFSVATLIQQRSNQKKKARYAYVGMAPEFNAQAVAAPSRQCNQGSLAPLLENKNEVEAIQQLLTGEIVSGAAANKAFFLEEGMHAQILHLATHACVDDQEPGRSKIFFSDDHLYAHELYQLQLQAQMVVLSACETGVGVFQRGEGVMSLARGFAQSGVPSLTLSYWSVSDQSTAQVMRHYYEALSEGQEKHEALRNAKLDYLRNQEQLQRLHPYYWSAFVHFGDVVPIDLKSGNRFFWAYILIFGLLITLLSYYLFGKKVNQSRA